MTIEISTQLSSPPGELKGASPTSAELQRHQRPNEPGTTELVVGGGRLSI